MAFAAVAGRKHEPMQLSFALYFSLFGCFKVISLLSWWHWWWWPLFQLKTYWRSCWQAESVLTLGPVCTTCHHLVSLPQQEVTGVKASLVRSNQPYVVSMDGFAITCLGSSALNRTKISHCSWCEICAAHCIPPETLLPGFDSFVWCWAHLCKHLCTFHKHYVGTRGQIECVQKDIPTLPMKLLMLPRASWGCSVMCNKLLLWGFVSSCEFNTVFKGQELSL